MTERVLRKDFDDYTRGQGVGSKKTKGEGEEGKGGIGKQGKRGKLTKGEPVCSPDLSPFTVSLFPFYPFPLLPRDWSVDLFSVPELDFDFLFGVRQIKMRHRL
jgi:hypothetical protein